MRVRATGAIAFAQHAVAAELEPADDRERGDAGLGGAVVGLARVAEHARRRRRVDDRGPAPALPAFACSRQYAAAWRVGANAPLRCTAITASHSDSSMLVSMRSRRMPALLTSVSSRPNVSIARCTMRPAPAKSATFSPSATASPPMRLDLLDDLHRGARATRRRRACRRRGRSRRPWRLRRRTRARARGRCPAPIRSR